jgi:hypothetical protein
MPTKVVNLGSVLKDHTSYWQNLDEFVPHVGGTLLAFDGADVLSPVSPEIATFLKTQRAIRVGMRQALAWATAASVVALVVRYRAQWLTLSAWVSQRVLAWGGALVGYSPPVVAAPEAIIWRQSVGWLVMLLAASWLTVALWTAWNGAAMADAQRGIYRVRRPLGVLLALFFQLLLTGIAVFTYDGPAWAIACGRPGRCPSGGRGDRAGPPCRAGWGWSDQPDEATASAVLAARALWNLLSAGVVALGVPLALFEGALGTQAYLASRVATGLSWAVASALFLAGTALWVAAMRALVAPAKKVSVEDAGPPAPPDPA